MENTKIRKISLKSFVVFEPINIDKLKIEFEKSNDIDNELEDNLIRDYIIEDDKVRISIINIYKSLLKNIKEYDYIFHLIWTCIKNRDIFQLWIIMRDMYLEKISKNDIERFVSLCKDKRNIHEFLRKYIIMGEYGFNPVSCVLYGQLDELWI